VQTKRAFPLILFFNPSHLRDVAVPVPLDATFTYRVGRPSPSSADASRPSARAHGRHLNKLHDSAPQSHDKEKKIQIKTVIVALDSEPRS